MEGVPADDLAKARQLNNEGNTLFGNRDYAGAAEKYQEVVQLVKVPVAYYNLAQCLVQLNRNLEAYEAIEAAFKYDGQGIPANLLDSARTTRKLIEGQVVAFELENSQEGVEITFDGKPILTGKGTSKFVTVPGSHALVATKPGHETETRSLNLVGGQPFVEKLSPLKVATRKVVLRRRWSATTPWIIVGAGAGIALLGGAGILVGNSDMATFNSQVSDKCKAGCTSGDASNGVDWGRESRARFEQMTGAGLAAAGGATLTAGLVMVFLNQPREVPTEKPKASPLPKVSLRPTMGGFAVAYSGRF